MSLKIAIESLVVGLAAQVAVGWISPFTPLLTGFVSGVINGNEKEGTVVGFLVGLLTALGFVIRIHLSLVLPYIYPTKAFIADTGIVGVYIIFVIMVIIGAVGGRVGGSVMERAYRLSYYRGRAVGEIKQRAYESAKEEIGKKKKTKVRKEH